MARELSAEDVRADHLASLGKELGPAFHAIYNEVAWLYVKWDQYTAIFGTTPERIKLANEGAPLFFRIVQDVLWEDTLLHLSRLTDSEGSMGKPNLTVRRLPRLIQEPQLELEVTGLVEIAVERTAFARDWRNRHIAHRDLSLALHEPTKQLAPASRLMVKEALDALAAILNQISHHYRDSQTVFDFSGNPGDAVALLHLLRSGLASRRARIERLQRGELLPEDYDPPPPAV